MNEASLKRAITLFERVTTHSVRTIRPLERDGIDDYFVVNLSTFIRIRNTSQADKAFYSSSNEFAVLRDLITKKKKPIVFLVNAFENPTGNMIAEYIPPFAFDEERDARFRFFRLAVESIKELHECTGDYLEFQPFERYEHYRELAEEHVREDYEKMVLEKVKAACSRSKRVLSHNRLANENLVYEPARKKMLLLGTEFVGMNYELFDIASLFAENEIEGRLKERLIHCYFGIENVTAALIDDINSAIEFLDLLWYFRSQALYKETLHEYYLKEAKRKMARIRKSIRRHYAE